MAYVFKEKEWPSLVDAKRMRERIFFVNQELAKIDDMLAGVMYYKKSAASPLHLHKNCEHFYFIINGKATVESDDVVAAIEELLREKRAGAELDRGQQSAALSKFRETELGRLGLIGS